MAWQFPKRRARTPKVKVPFWQGRFGRLIALWVPLTFLAAVPVLSAWRLNSYLDTLQDLPVPLVLGCFSALLAGLIFVRGFGRDRLAGYLGAVFLTLLLSAKYEDRLGAVSGTLKSLDPLPDIGAWQDVLLSVVFIGLASALGWWVAKAISKFVMSKRGNAADFCGGVSIVIATVFLFQALPAGRTIVREWPEFWYRPPALSTSASSVGQPKPDVYYIVLDRYASQAVLGSQFNYDNSPFASYLQENGFSVDPDAHQNYPYTTMSIASTLNANYHSDAVEKFSGAEEQTIEPYHDSIRYASVIQQFKALGYSFSQLGSWYEASNKAPLADHEYQPEGQLTILGHTFTLNTFAKYQLTASPFWRLVQHGIQVWGFHIIGYGAISEHDATLYKIDTLKSLASQPAGGRFIFAHILVPHDPYIFNADGSYNVNGGSDDAGELEKQKYVNQVQFINSQMQDVISQINLATNGQAVIVLQSDEGPYPTLLNSKDFSGSSDDEIASGSMLDWPDQDLKMKFGILAAYHIPQVTPDALAQGGDSVNIFRLVFNTYFGAGLTYLPRCYYAYPDGRSSSFTYADITQRLTGQANAQCSANSDFGPGK